jgi:hypothetical protein
VKILNLTLESLSEEEKVEVFKSSIYNFIGQFQGGVKFVTKKVLKK